MQGAGEQRRNTALSAAWLAAALVGAAVLVAGIALALGLGGTSPTEIAPVKIARSGSGAPGSSDPLAWAPSREADYERRAALAFSHGLYALSPGGAEASARRTARWRDEIDAAARREGVDADLLEAMIFLESAGRPEVMAGPDPRAASGLGQILPSTATDLLGMRVDLPASLRLTKEIRRAERKGRPARAKRLSRERARVDQRFDPGQAIAGAARYLHIAAARFGREDLAVESYHMGIGNLTSVIHAYVEPGDTSGPVGDLVAREGLSYGEIYFNSSPLVNPHTHAVLAGFGDESADYLWKVLAARRIMELWRDDPSQLERTARLELAKATSEEVFHPEDQTEVFSGPDDVQSAIDDGKLAPLPDDPGSLGYRISPKLGELAGKLDQSPDLYAALRPGALATLIYMAARVRAISGDEHPLIVTSATRDRAYQDLLVGVNPEATPAYSLHTTGWAFDVRRNYGSNAQAQAFQFVLDRLRALAVLDYAVEPDAIHVTVSDSGDALANP